MLREAKALVPSALQWVRSDGDPGAGLKEMLASPLRCPDPFHAIHGQWVVRRLAADSAKIELKDLERVRTSAEMKLTLFESMGAELGNLHLGSGKWRELCKELETRDAPWLHKQVDAWARRVEKDYAAYCRQTG